MLRCLAISEADYLEGEKLSEIKHEYIAASTLILCKTPNLFS